MAFIVPALKACTGIATVVLTVHRVKSGQPTSMLVVAQGVRTGMDLTVSPVEVEGHGTQLSIAVRVPSDSIGMEPSVSVVREIQISMDLVVLLVTKVRYGTLPVQSVNVPQVSSGMAEFA